MIKRLNLALLVAALAAILVPAAFARPLLDEPAGKGGPPPPPGSCSTPTLSGPTQARVGDAYTVSGCGFPAGAAVALEITEAGGCCGAVNRWADSTGAFSYSGSVWGVGAYRVRASLKQRNRWRVVASWSFQATG